MPSITRFVSGLFAAGGTGEYFSLTPDETDTVVRAALAEVPDGPPVIAPAGRSTAEAVDAARHAERAGAHGLLLFPPYLAEAPQEGLAAYARTVCAATALAFYSAVRAHDRAEVARRLAGFVLPYCDIRRRRSGYAVAIVKAGMRAAGLPAGPVRSPLTDLDEGDYAELAMLVGKARPRRNV